MTPAELLAIAARGLRAAEAPIEAGGGVAGLHLNGDLASWGELRSGGTYEEWLRDFDLALTRTSEVGP